MEILINNDEERKMDTSSVGGRTGVSRPLQLVQGYDRLEVSLHLSIDDHSLFDDLAFWKKKCQTSFGDSIPFNFGNREFFSWNLKRKGNKLFTYILESGDISLCLSDRSADSTIPNCKIEFGSVTCHSDLFKRYELILGWLRAYGLNLEKEIVSRVDLCLDFVGLHIGKTHVSNPDLWVTRARKFNLYYQDWNLTGVMLGKGVIALRVYDKALEIASNPTKALFFYDLWNLSLPTAKKIPVTRVEFQFRRDVLKEFSSPVTTVQELRESVDSLWQYATTRWARQADSPVDRKNRNQDKVNISDFWQMVQGVLFNIPLLAGRRCKKNLHKNIESLKAQARGCLLSIAAAAGHDPDDFFGIIATVSDTITTEFSEFMTDRYSDFVKLFNVRARECYVGF